MKDEKVSENIKEAARKAVSTPGSHGCHNDPDSICPITSAVSSDLIFVKKPARECPYYIPFGYSGFCNFPPRKNLYKEYSI